MDSDAEYWEELDNQSPNLKLGFPDDGVYIYI